MANDGSGKVVVDVKIVSEGLSEAGNLYSAEVLKEAVQKFDGVPVHNRFQTTEEAVARRGRMISELCGHLGDVKFTNGAIRGTFKVLPGHANEVLEAMTGKQLCLRMAITAESHLVVENDKSIRVVDKILAVDCVVPEWMLEDEEEEDD